MPAAKVPSMAEMQSAIDKAQKIRDTVLFPRWTDVPEVKGALEKMKDLAGQHRRLTSSGKSEDAMKARKVWESLASAWWNTLFALLDAQTDPARNGGKLPDQLTFDETERLFIDFGILADGTLPLHDNFNADPVLSSFCDVGIFPCLSFSDYIAECWSMIVTGPETIPTAGPAASRRAELLAEELEKAQRMRDEVMTEIAKEHAPNLPIDMAKLTEEMDKGLLSAMKIAIRTPEYREAKEGVRQQISQERAAYLEAEKAVLLMLSSARKNAENPLTAQEMAEALALHENTRVLAKKMLYCQSDERKIARRAQKIADNCKGAPDAAKRAELRSMLSKKREHLTVPGKTARCDTSPLAPAGLPLDYRAGALELEAMAGTDMDMFDVPRVRMYGIPRIVFIPAQGLGAYDWADNTLLIPVFPVNGEEEKSAAYALAAFRWDSDEDRRLKNPYEQIKENRKKSLVVMAASFCKDYATWMTKERKGYRLLPRETHKVFTQMFAPRKEEA